MRKLVMILLAFVFLFLVARAGESTGGTLTGTVVQADGTAITGVSVQATAGQVPRHTATDPRGRWTLRGLAPGTYTVELDFEDSPALRMESVPVSIGVITRVTVTVTGDGIPEGEVSILGAEPASAVSHRVEDVAPYVPLSRNVASLYNLAPVTDGGFPQLGTVNASVSGGSGLENVAFVEGANVTETGLGGIGTYSSWSGSLGLGLTVEFLDEVRVETGAFGAETGRAGGGVIRSVLRSGTNRLGFDLAWYESPSGLEGDHELLLRDPYAANLVASRRSDFFVAGHGPAIPERLYFFAAYNPVSTEEEFTLTSGNADEAWDLDGNGTEDDFFDVGESIAGGRLPETLTRKRSIDNYALKLTGFASRDHKLELVAFGDPSDGDEGPQDPLSHLLALADPFDFNDPESRAKGLSWGGDHLVIRHQGTWSSRLFSELTYARRDAEFAELPHDVSFRCFFDPLNNCFWGGDGPFQDIEEKRDQWSAKLTHVLGPLELRYGLQVDDIRWRETQINHGPAYTAYVPRLVESVDIDLDGDGSPDVLGTGLLGDGSLASSYTAVPSSTDAVIDWDVVPPGALRYEVRDSRFGPIRDFTESRETNLFAQAGWAIRPDLTLRAGLRWTRLEMEGAGAFTAPFSQLSGGALSGVGETSFESRGYEFPDELAPRLGLTWDVRSDGRHKLFTHFGEYYGRMPGDLAQRGFSPWVEITGERFLDSQLLEPAMEQLCWTDQDGNGVYETSVACHDAGSLTAIPPHAILEDAGDETRLPYVEEWLAGYAWQIDDFASLEVRYINRRLRRIVEDVQLASNEQLWNLWYGSQTFGGEIFPGHGTADFGAYVLSNPGENVSSTLFPRPARDYDGIELIARFGPLLGWRAYLDYRFSRLEGNFSNACRDLCFISSLYDFPAVSAIDRNGDGTIDDYLPSGTMAGVYSEGPLPNDRRHILNAYVARQFDMGLNLGARLSVRSGQPHAAYLAHPAYRFGPEVPGAEAEYWWLLRVDTDGDGAQNGLGLFTSDDGALTTFPDRDYDGDGSVDAVLGRLTGPRLWSYETTARDALGRTDTVLGLDLHASYDLRLRGGKSTLTLLLDVFNVLDQTDVLELNDSYEVRTGQVNPNFGRATYYQLPRSVRLGAKLTW